MDTPAFPSPGEIARLRHYIQEMWNRLTRSPRHVLAAVRDPKFPAIDPRRVPLYVAATEKVERVRRRLEKCHDAEELADLDIRPLPPDARDVTEHGLLYLPGRYVVPGGRFNELYGWDSYFIILGLLRDGRTGLAKSVADQLLYEVEHYGMMLTANRTYYLTRSHPPLLGRMVLAVYHATGDLDWLEDALPLLEKYYFYWDTPPQTVPAAAGLARYCGFGEGPCAEVVASERDESGRTHYERLRDHLSDLPPGERPDNALDPAGGLSATAYRGDRAMRESGFDVSWRFGPGGVESTDFTPVCLNTLLWLLEADIAHIREILDDTASVQVWHDRATQRAERIHELLWEESDGLFFDWNARRGTRRRYPFATTFWPLWAGLATREQADRVARNLPLFEVPGGLQASTCQMGAQWDAPFVWAPLVLFAVEGLDRYGYTTEARRIAIGFITMVAAEFRRTGRLFEKYDGVRGTSEVASLLHFGYPENAEGFGWTNACVVELLGCLAQIGRRPPSPVPA